MTKARRNTKERPVPDHKEMCRELAPDGWHYIGFDEGHYLFQTGNYADGFKVMKCCLEDITAENLALMVRLGVTRV